MNFIFNKEILSSSLSFYREAEAYSGVNKIAEKVRNDISLVFGVKPEIIEDKTAFNQLMIVYGTVGHSPILDDMDSQGLIDLSRIRDKNEVYLHQIVNINASVKALVIAGSDKRGTIYGLFRLSEMLGVSPLVDWCNVMPQKLEEYVIADDYKFVSKEPSVRFRGFFINDEWPAFGNWCTKNFGGFNAKAYEHVFELLLRLKGNYLWPAMWSARFHDDGPGLLNAELADEYGVVMGMSHHEPCLRQGEEYKYLRGKDSIYGDAWNFRTNEAGITKFWEDGLKRSGKFESVITVGMRGEADTAIMGKNATLADNIELLRDVLKTQRRLIKQYVNEDISKVPRMIALYKEVEEFFYGNETAKGLIGSEELEDVILMLCDDNFGNLRTLPTEEMRKHQGGYGMYYHFDYHGWPISFEWINSSFLPKVWEQMSMAYDFGIRDLWIVNVGDICTQEFPLSYFLDLAYDFDSWGTNAINKTEEYTKAWIEQQFRGVFDGADQDKIYEILNGYTKIASRRRPEAMNTDIYHPVNYKETASMLNDIEHLLGLADDLYKKLDKDKLPAYVALVYYPAVGNLNVYRMQLYTGLNHYFANRNAVKANEYADIISECMTRDKELVEEYHTIADGKWYGMGLSEHIGFTRWNEDECRNPVMMKVFPADKPRIMLMIDGTEQSAEGSGWLNRRLGLNDFMNPDAETATFTLYNITDMDSEFTITNNTPWLTCSSTGGVLNGSNHTNETVTVTIDRSKLMVAGDLSEEKITDSISMKVATGEIEVELPAGKCTVVVSAVADISEIYGANTFVETKGYIAIEAEHFNLKKDMPVENKQTDIQTAGFAVIKDYGKTLSAVKVFPTTEYFTAGKDAPYLEYRLVMREAGDYEAELYLQPSNPVSVENKVIYAIQANEDSIEKVNIVPEGARVGDHQEPWSLNVLNNIRRCSSKIKLNKGINILRVFAVTPGVVIEKLVIYPVGAKPAEAYLGPTETYRLNIKQM